jgi:hypothetical protein
MNIEHSVDVDELIAKLAAADAEIKRLEERDEVWRAKKNMLQEENAQLMAEVERLKCCGNCVHHYRPDLAPKCEAMFDFCYCDNWTPDGLTRERRKYGLADE